MDVPGMGKFAVVMDRQDAIIKAIEPSTPSQHPTEPASGQFYWNELLTTDTPSARSFYQSVFGWSAIDQFTQGKGEHTLMRAGDEDVAGIMPMSSQADHPPAWLTYFYAENIDERFALAESLGAQTVIAPRDIPDACRFCVQVDPVGAVFAMMQLPSEELPG
jgi:predicted enzyme related to lactoylglutathione lyase